MTWFDLFIENFSKFWNAPIPIIGFTVGAVILGALALISKTSIGNKALRKLTKMFEDLKAEILEYLKMFREYRENREKLEEEMEKRFEKKVEEIIQNCENRIKELEDTIKAQGQLLMSVAVNAHNVKVNEALKNYSEVDANGRKETTNS